MKGLHFPLAAALVGLSISAWAAPEALWSVGKADGTSDEFSPKVTNPKQTVVYTVGKSQPADGWFSFQPTAGAGAVPREIRFSFDQVPAASESLRLKLWLLVERAGVPAMQVEVNGRKGLFYLDPTLDNRMGDSTGGNRTGYSRAEVEFDISSDYLKAGENVIALLPVKTSEQIVPDAGINYDAIELFRVPVSEAVSARIQPTIFYKESGSGLTELVHVFVRYAGKPGPAEVTLEIAGKTYKQTLAGDRDFGEERRAFDVAEFPKGSPATVSFTLNGRETKFTQIVDPQKKWTVFVVPHIHLDVGYTDYHPKVAMLQARVLEQAMDLVSIRPEFRFSTDGSWNLNQFMKSRSSEEQKRMIEALRLKKLFIPAQYCCLLTGFPTTETLIRSLYHSANFSRKNDTPFDYANLTDVPSHTWSYPSILASAGIKYFFAGSNSDRGPILLIGRLNEASPMYWEGPDKKKVLLWYSRVYRQVQMLFGLPPLVDAGSEMLPVFLQMYSNPSYRADSVILYGTQGENRELFPQQAELIANWNKRYAFPKLEYTGFKDAVENIAKQFGGSIPTVSGDGGPYWEDGLASNPFHLAMERANERRGLSAEKITTISSLVNPRLKPDKDAFDMMWTNMVLYDEHTQVVSNKMPEHDTLKTIAQLEVKNSYAIRAHEMSTDLLMGGMANVVDSIAAERGNLVVFNTLNWKRAGLLTVDLGDGEEIVDLTTNKTVPHQSLSKGSNFQRVQFMADDVPAMGYKIYTMRQSPRKALEQADETTVTLEDVQALERGKPKARAGEKKEEASVATTMENDFYRVELDPESGSVRSIFDKELKKELVDKDSPYRFGQYLFVTGGDEKPNGILQYAKTPPKLDVHKSEKGRLVSMKRTPYGWSARLESTAVYTPRIATEIRLFDKQKKIEFIQDVRKNQIYFREGIYFAFPFAMKQPQFQFEIQNGVVDPAKNMLAGAGLEWFTVQNWVSVQQDGLSGTVMPLDAPLVTLGDINRGEWPSEFGRRKGTIFSFVVNNYHQPRSVVDFGVETKNDELRFRYVVTSAGQTDPVALSRQGWQEMTPLAGSEVQPQDRSWVRSRAFTEKEGKFIECEDPALVLLTWKAAEDGDGTILRFVDLGGKKRSVPVTVPISRLTEVQLTDAVERNQKKIPLLDEHRFQIDVEPHGIITVRVKGTSALHIRQPADGYDQSKEGLNSPFGALTPKTLREDASRKKSET